MAHSDNDARGSEDDPSPTDRSSTHDEDMDVPEPSSLGSNPDSVHDDDVSDHFGDDSIGEYLDEDDGGLLGIGLATLTLVVGVILFLFPEPATSTLGLVLLAIGAVMWLSKLVT
jgi:hypothetical protein